MNRREFLYSAAGAAGLVALGGGVRLAVGAEPLLRPPGGQDEARFIGACVHCERCRSACPQGCLGTAGFESGVFNARTPILDFKRGFCDFCGVCVEVCPTQALVAFDATNERLGCAVLERELCVKCGKCRDCCPYGALTWDEGSNLPVVDTGACNGCGICEHLCPSSSYGTAGNAHRRAIAVERA